MGGTLTNKKLLILCIGIAVATVVAIVVILSLVFSSGILNETIVTANIWEEPYEERTFTIEESGTYAVNIALQSKGFLTAVRIVDESGEVVYQDIAEAYTAEFAMDFRKGAHTLSLTHLLEYAVVEQFYEYTGQTERFSESSDYYREFFAQNQDMSTSAVFSITIQ
jgi:hypothetical protein